MSFITPNHRLPLDQLVHVSVEITPYLAAFAAAGGAGSDFIGPVDMFNNGGFLQLISGSGYPISPDGLDPGDFWNDGDWIAVIPGGVANPDYLSPSLFFPGITALQLLQHGGANLGTSAGPIYSGLVYINNGLVAVS